MKARRSRIDENKKITLTLGQLKRLVKESTDDEGDFEIEDGVLVKYHGKGGNVVIPDGVREIGWCAFEFCERVTSVMIPNSVTNISDHAFYGCGNLKSVKIPNSITSLESFVFEYCDALIFVTIPDSVTSLGDYVFHSCTNLKSMTIPNSVKSIGSGVFLDCPNLKTIHVENEDQKEMLLDGDNDFNSDVKIIVKGSDIDEDGFLVEDINDASGNSVSVFFRTMEHIDDHAGTVVFPSIDALVKFLNAIGAEYTEEIANRVAQGKMVPIDLPNKIVQLGVHIQ